MLSNKNESLKSQRFQIKLSIDQSIWEKLNSSQNIEFAFDLTLSRKEQSSLTRLELPLNPPQTTGFNIFNLLEPFRDLIIIPYYLSGIFANLAGYWTSVKNVFYYFFNYILSLFN
ncbi:hypothetical protein PCC7424_0781 [Gloeothece citriformis PCC 7424]|uniref:Uncharacterized protein n=1 Tax=Gloeothece citriformis (strain PCC 7424) TaxID=65393 RepID=B7KG44_GLOC7|nr:hypothetical protein PCC7424_0781 [Gloeothece citriformis PCC 7424]